MEWEVVSSQHKQIGTTSENKKEAGNGTPTQTTIRNFHVLTELRADFIYKF